MNEMQLKRQEISYNLDQALKTILKSYKIIDNLIKIIEEETNNTLKNKLLLKYLQSKENLRKVDEHIQKMQFYNKQEMDEELEKEMNKYTYTMANSLKDSTLL